MEIDLHVTKSVTQGCLFLQVFGASFPLTQGEAPQTSTEWRMGRGYLPP